jgi:hypothetical protein
MVQFKPVIRLATSDDAQKICALFNRVSPMFNREIDFWVWINRLLSDEKSIVAIAEIEGVIVGHYAIIPQEILIEGSKHKVGFGLHAVIEAGKSGLVSIFEISNLAYLKAKELGLQFIYGFPNKNYRLIQEKIERWEKISLFQAYELNMERYSVQKDIDSLKIEKINNSHESIFKISQVLDKVDIQTKCSFNRNLIYYQNRYINHPQHLYSCYIIIDSNGNKAIVFLKKFKDGNLIKGHLIDFIKEKDFKTESLIDMTASIFKNENVNLLSFWPVNFEMKSMLEFKNFTATGFDTFFGLKFLDRNFKSKYRDLLLEIDNWKLVMGDSDAF